MQMSLPLTPRVLNPLFKDIFCFFNKLSVKIDCVRINAPRRVVLAKDKLRRLSVILLHLAAVRFALLAEFFGCCAVAGRVCFLGLVASLF